MHNTIKSVVANLDVKKDKTKPLLVQLHEIVQVFLERTDAHNKISNRIYQHTLRSMNIADKILKKETGDREIILISLLLHDIGKTLTTSKHDIVSYSLAKEILTNLEVEEGKKNKILNCILTHSSKDITCLDLTMEQKIMMDADILDEIGCLSIVKLALRTPSRNIKTGELLMDFESLIEKINSEEVNVKTNYGKLLYSKRKKVLKDMIASYKEETIMFKF